MSNLVLEWVENSKDLVEINNFDDLLSEIAYAYEPQYPIVRQKDGVYIVHKLAIGKNFTEYKGHYMRLAPGIYEQLEAFFDIKRES